MKTIPNLPYGEEPWKLFDLYLPDVAPRGTAIWFHGGGLENGTRKDIHFAADLVAAGFAIASVSYRLYPKAHFPEYVEDAADAAAYIRANYERLGAGGPLYVTGQSAGAYLVMLLALDRSRLARHGLSPEDFAGFVSDSSQMTAHFRVLAERGFDSRLERIDETAPIFFLDPATTPPPMLVIHYAEDIPCRPEQNRLFVRNLKVLHPDADVTHVELPGGHSSGSTGRGPDGAFAFVTAFLKWVAR
ncbi:MAG: alpha/beta hydrolase [Kiritimatiellae bacterium]|nr:alpha/beta hydrolase [Kiritimatiellia bacterium]